MKDNVLDELDKAILILLATNAKMPVKQIAEKVFASAPTVNTRIMELSKSGIIKGYRAEIDTARLGDSIKCYINIEVDTSLREPIYEFLKNSKNVISCDRVTGEYSFVVQAIFENMHEMDSFVNEAQRFGKTKTQIVFSTIISPRNVIV